ncbi:MAG: hypothetical protein ABJI22_12345 [Maribacter sp.]
MKIKDTVNIHYPSAKTGDEITESYLSLLETEYKSDLKKMLFATSVCSDDVNVSTDFRKVLSRPFTYILAQQKKQNWVVNSELVSLG